MTPIWPLIWLLSSTVLTVWKGGLKGISGLAVFTTVWESEVIGVFFQECACVHICIGECVGLCVWVGFFIVPWGYGFGKANLGLRALGPCQAHQPISYAKAYMQTCTSMPPPPPPPFASPSTVTHSFILYVETSHSLCVSCHSHNQTAYLQYMPPHPYNPLLCEMSFHIIKKSNW